MTNIFVGNLSYQTTQDDLHAAFQSFARDNVKIVVALMDAMFLNERKRIALLAMAARLPPR